MVGAALVIAAVISGCATTTSPSRSAEVASELRAPSRLDVGLSSDTRAQQYFVRGLTQAQIGNHGEALNYFSEALRLAPNTAAVLAAAAESHAALGDETSALYSARQARDAEPENLHYHIQLAQLHLAVDQPRRAAEIYADLRERFPHNPDVLYQKARVHAMMGEYEDAIAVYEDLLQEIGPDRDVHNEILHLLTRLGDLEGKERILSQMLESDPHDAELRKMLSEVFVRQGNSELAAEQLERVVSDQPGDADALMDLANLYRERGMADSADAILGRLANLDASGPSQLLTQAAALYARAGDDEAARQAAEQLLERVLEMQPTNADALVMLGDIRLMQEAYEEAGDLLYRAVSANPRDRQIWVQAAGAFLEAGNHERAVQVADEALVLFPGSVPLLQVAGYALTEAYKNREAADRFEAAVAIITEDPSEGRSDLSEMYAALGLLYDRMGDHDASDEAYERAIASDGSNAAALNNYAYSLAERGIELGRALEHARRAVEIDGKSPSFIDTLGWIYFKRGDREEALRWLERAAALEGASAAVFEHLGEVHEALGNLEQARTARMKALEMDPANTWRQNKLEAR